MVRPSILVVDDEKPIRKTLRMTLEYEGYYVLEASSGREAVEKLNREPTDLVFLDIKMPYNLTVATEQAVLASLEDTDHLLLRVRWLVEERERMMGMLQGLPQVECYPSKGNFVLCRLPAGTGEAVHEALQRRGVFVRYFATPRLKDCLRISSGMPEDTDVLVGALREALKEVT